MDKALELDSMEFQVSGTERRCVLAGTCGTGILSRTQKGGNAGVKPWN